MMIYGCLYYVLIFLFNLNKITCGHLLTGSLLSMHSPNHKGMQESELDYVCDERSDSAAGS